MADQTILPQTLDQAITIPITDSIPLPSLSHLLSSPPFIAIPGSFNVRDLSDGTQPAIRSSYVYRSGTLEKLVPPNETQVQSPGHAALLTHNITTIFDLRAHRERLTAPEPILTGLDIHWHPSTWENDTTSTHQISERKESEFSFTTMYTEMLSSHRASFKAVFEHIRDSPDRPLLFHCTAGKDRTGIMAALVLGVAGAPLEYINRDYALTRIGIEPVREFLIAKLMAGRKAEDFEDPNMKAYAKVP